MGKISVLWVVVGVLGICHSGIAQTPSPDSPSAPYRAVLNRYCVTCHNERLKTADLMLDTMDVSNIAAGAPVWEKVVRKLRTGSMPPSGMPRPDQATYDSFATYLESELDRAAAASPNPGRPVPHRLNRTEYANAVRDLLAIQIDDESLLPADDAGRGFDNIAEVLSVSPLLVERYMAAAREISRLAVGDPNIRTFTQTYDVSRHLVQDDRMSENLPFGSRGGIAVRHYFPADGEYIIKVRLQRNNDNYIRGLDEPHQLDVRLEGARLKLFTVGGEPQGKSGPLYTFINRCCLGEPQQEKYEFTADQGLEVRFPAKAGSRLVQVAFLKDASEQEGALVPQQTYEDLLSYKGGDPGVDSIAVTGPYDAQSVGDTPSRRRIFVCSPTGSKNGNPQLVSLKSHNGSGSDDTGGVACAKKILSNLAHRAYRRPLTDADLQSLLGFYKVGRSNGNFEAGIATAIQGILVSPEFLFRVEKDPPNAVAGTNFRISDLELASRLSFFLWSSIPDDQLLDLAERGKLKQPEVLEQQVRRMLADSRSNALVVNFTDQWLGLRKLETMSPDPDAFPDFDDNLRDALLKETNLFAESIAREDRSILDFLNADYTFLNERLARHYGIGDVYGSEFRRVNLQDETRRGLLGKGSVLAVTSYGNRTAPTLRGKWLLENILGTPPPPPPPNVPSLKENGKGKILTMRERMEQHRANPACAVCHTRMDPLGFALENFDALGKWRTNEGASAIDSSGVLPDGTKFHGPDELREILLSRRQQFFTTFTEKLLMYALGRGVDYYDEPVVRSILRQAAPNNYRWSSLVSAIVASTPFQMRRSTEP